ncbi:CHASE3 domain-containing protein, partial [Pantoea ananatis]|uniref:CHASE3 domain-containing protein n=1 Tax=Pantoea ananas TaxID=553 RepID=UPI001B30DC19
MKLSTRLATGFGLIILLSIICTGTAIQALYKARKSMDEVVNVKMKKSNLAQDMLLDIKDMASFVRTIGLLSEPADMKSADEKMQNSKA